MHNIVDSCVRKNPYDRFNWQTVFSLFLTQSKQNASKDLCLNCVNCFYTECNSVCPLFSDLGSGSIFCHPFQLGFNTSLC